MGCNTGRIRRGMTDLTLERGFVSVFAHLCTLCHKKVHISWPTISAMSATTALRQSRYQTVAQTATRPNTSIIPPSALLPEKESWTCSERRTRIGSKHPPSVIHTEGIFIPVTNYTSVPLSLRRLLLNLFRHVDQTKAVEHPINNPINIRHTPDISQSLIPIAA